MKEKYETLSLAVLKDVAKARGLKGTSALKKSDLIDAFLKKIEKTRKRKKGSTQRKPGMNIQGKRKEREKRTPDWSFPTWTAV